ncbi:MAG: hypothetical protein JNL98_34160 [Bryobacterales bacterium]|nr:hypothetical protein [Bryobacterales bacterium]
MADNKKIQDRNDILAALKNALANQLSGDLVQNPQLAEILVQEVERQVDAVELRDSQEPPPPDGGLAQLAGVGAGAATNLGETRLVHGVQPYDETVTSERIQAVADLYYIYQHERIGVFRVVRKLQDLFRAGSVRLSSGSGAFALYQFDRRQVLRYTMSDRLSAYRRALGFGTRPLPAGARPNTEFQSLFTHFVQQVTLYWRDKRVSDVIRTQAYDPSFGSIAIVRRAGLDLRNNLKFTSYGHLNVLRVEVMQLLEEAFRILESEDVKKLFGAETAWDVIEEVKVRYLDERVTTSPLQRMAVAGRDVLEWLAQGHILQGNRTQFEALLADIAEAAEEWLTSAQSLGVAQRRGDQRVLPFERRQTG